MAGWSAEPLRDIPMIEKEEPGDPEWFPVSATSADRLRVDVYSASAAGDDLLERHDETRSVQEELYLVVAGEALFELDGEEVRAEAPFVVAVDDPAVMRAARAVEAGAMVVASAASDASEFDSSWESRHFDGVPQA